MQHAIIWFLLTTEFSDIRGKEGTHVHAHVPGFPLAQVLFRSYDLKAAEGVPVLFPELLDVLFVVNFLRGEPTSMHLCVEPCA